VLVRTFLIPICSASALISTLAAQSTASAWRPLLGVRVGRPQQASLYVGAIRLTDRHTDGYAGIALAVEPGLGGGQVSLGLASMGGPSAVARLQLSILRTWKAPLGVAGDQTFVGVEGRLGVLFIGLGLGGYKRVAGNAPGDSWLFSISAFGGN
jgi:hypothetical protein